MLEPDVQARLIVARERQARLAQDAPTAETPKLDVKRQSSITRRRRMRLRVHLRPAREGS